MTLLFALLLIIVGVAQIATAVDFGPFDVHSHVGNVANKYPMTKQDLRASEKAVQHMEYFRRFIHTGVGRNIPPLDLYSMERLVPIRFGIGLRGTLQITNLKMKGAAAFSVKKMEMYLKTHRMDFEISVPEVVTTAHFSLINFEYFGLRFNVSGDIEVGMNKYDTKGALSMHLNPKTHHYEPSGLDVHVHVDHGWIKSGSMVGLPPMIEVAIVRDAVFEAVAKHVVEDIRDVLGRYPTEQVDKFMEP